MAEFMEKNLTGSRKQLFTKLNQNIIQGGGNTAVIETESLRYFTQKEKEEAQKEWAEN